MFIFAESIEEERKSIYAYCLFRIIGVYGSSTNGYVPFVNFCRGFAALVGWSRETL